jgi:putative glutamine amidotransferase
MQHVPDEVTSSIAHEQGKIPVAVTESSHDINIREGTKLHDIFGTESLHVNSTHHQAVKEPGDGIVITATAPDGVIEAIEMPEHKFCIGVQWHPEYEINMQETKLFESFVEACK